PNVIGVDGPSDDIDQIEYENGVGSESIVIDLNGNATTAEFDVTRLFNNEGSGEQGVWIAYYQGTVVAYDTFSVPTGGSSTHEGSFTIDTGGLVFDRVEFQATPYIGGTGGSDDSDYFLTGFEASGGASVNTAYTIAEDQTLAIDASSSDKLLDNDSDPEGDSFTLTGINGSAVTDGQMINLPSGAILTIYEDGHFDYDPNGQYDSLGAGEVATDTFTYTITDQYGATDTATATITIIGKGTETQINNTAPTVSASTAIVSEEGLTAGIADSSGTPADDTDNAVHDSSSPTYSSMAISDTDGDSLTVSLQEPTDTLTSNGQSITWSGGGTTTLVGTATLNGTPTEVIRIEMDNSGEHTVTLSAPIDHPTGGQEDEISFNVNVSVSDGLAITTQPLTIQIEDDMPLAPVSSQNLDVSAQTNILIILDVSGSMGNSSGVPGLSRLDMAKQAIDTLMNDYLDYGDVRVKIVTYSTDANTLGTQWMTVNEANAALASVTDGGGTNYDLAVEEAQTAFTQPGKLDGGQNVSYFFSDGNPTLSNTNPYYSSADASQNQSGVANPGNQTNLNYGDGIQSADPSYAGPNVDEESNWETFLTNNGINSFSIGVGSGVSQTYLDPLAYNGSVDTNGDGTPDGTETNATVVTDLSQLNNFVSSTVTPPPVEGNIITGGLVGSGGFGADDSYVLSLSVDGTTYTYDPVADTITVTTTPGSSDNHTFDTVENEITIDTAQNGQLIVNLDTGDYSYISDPNNLGSYSEIVGFSLQDADGDSASGETTLNISRTPGSAAGRAAQRGDAPASDDDTLVFEGDPVDGGIGFDTLIVPNDNDLDFSAIADGTIQNIEQIDLTAGNHDILNLSVADVLDITDNDNLLEILGDSADSVSLTSDWQATGNTVSNESGQSFTEYQDATGTTTLLIEDSVNVTIV
ncbi:MAG: VWA domain-containing protein, partial [Chromatiales bacterium]|nr:VWA domain-containing protein [Chromatiales bacterium]